MAQDELIIKFGPWLRGRENRSVSSAPKRDHSNYQISNDRTTVHGILNKLVDAKVLLRFNFLTDVLAEVK